LISWKTNGDLGLRSNREFAPSAGNKGE